MMEEPLPPRSVWLRPNMLTRPPTRRPPTRRNQLPTNHNQHSSVLKSLDVNFENALKMVAFSKGNDQESALLLLKSGKVFGIGSNKNNCLGLNLEQTLEPVKIKEITGISGVSVCGELGDALAYTEEGKLYVWGKNVSETDSEKPVLLQNLPKIKDARCIHGHYMALTTSGKVYEWRGDTTYSSILNTLNTVPTAVELDDDVISFACGFHHSLAVTKNGDVYSWGKRYISDVEFEDQPITKLQFPGETIDKVVCGGHHSLALTQQSGKIFTWGFNPSGLGDVKDNIVSNTPIQVGGSIGRFVDIAANGWQTNVAVTDTGVVYIWGEDEKNNDLETVTITEYSGLQQVLSTIKYSNCVWLCEDWNCCTVTTEDAELLGKKMAPTFNKKDFSDCTLLVENKPIYVHKYILNLRSEFFRTWLQDHWTDENKRELVLTCYDYEVYWSYVWFLYSGEVRVPSEYLLDLWDLANAYSEEILKLGCETIIDKNMTKKTMTLLYSKMRTMRIQESVIKNEDSKPLEEKIYKIKDNYEKECQRLRSNYKNVLEKLKNEHEKSKEKDALQVGKIKSLLEFENCKQENKADEDRLELFKTTFLKCKEHYIKLRNNLEFNGNSTLKDNYAKFKTFEEGCLKLEEEISVMKDDRAKAEIGIKVDGSNEQVLSHVVKKDNKCNVEPEAGHSKVAIKEQSLTELDIRESVSKIHTVRSESVVDRSAVGIVTAKYMYKPRRKQSRIKRLIRLKNRLTVENLEEERMSSEQE